MSIEDKLFLIPANICPIVPAVLYKSNRRFEFIDISNETLCIDEDIVLKKIRKNPLKYTGIIYVRTFGYLVNKEDFFSKIKEINEAIVIIDDRCLAIPDFEDKSKSVSDLVLYSTGYSKYVDIGWGGYGFWNNAKIGYKKRNLTFRKTDFDKLSNDFRDSIKNNKKFRYVDSEWLGCCNSFSEYDYDSYKELILSRLESVSKHKSELNRFYSEELPSEIQLGSEYQNWRFNILVPDKDKLLQAIFDEGLFASSHYAPISHLFADVAAENAQKLHEKIINLFNDFRFNKEKAFRVVEIIQQYI